MSDLFGDHIVGFPMRRLTYVIVKHGYASDHQSILSHTQKTGFVMPNFQLLPGHTVG